MTRAAVCIGDLRDIANNLFKWSGKVAAMIPVEEDANHLNEDLTKLLSQLIKMGRLADDCATQFEESGLDEDETVD